MLIPITLDIAPSWTDVVVAIAAIGTFLVAAIAAFLGLRQFWSYQATTREQSRPYVLVDLVTRQTLILLALKNVGTRPAANVIVTFDPEMQSTVEDWQTVVRSALSGDEPLPVIAPGRAINWFFDNGLFAVASPKVPQDYRVSISYEDLVPRVIWDRSRLPWRKHFERYEEHGHKLSLRQFNETALDEPGLPEIAKATADIARKMPARSMGQALRNAKSQQ